MITTNEEAAHRKLPYPPTPAHLNPNTRPPPTPTPHNSPLHPPPSHSHRFPISTFLSHPFLIPPLHPPPPPIHFSSSLRPLPLSLPSPLFCLLSYHSSPYIISPSLRHPSTLTPPPLFSFLATPSTPPLLFSLLATPTLNISSPPLLDRLPLLLLRPLPLSFPSPSFLSSFVPYHSHPHLSFLSPCDPFHSHPLSFLPPCDPFFSHFLLLLFSLHTSPFTLTPISFLHPCDPFHFHPPPSFLSLCDPLPAPPPFSPSMRPLSLFHSRPHFFLIATPTTPPPPFSLFAPPPLSYSPFISPSLRPLSVSPSPHFFLIATPTPPPPFLPPATLHSHLTQFLPHCASFFSHSHPHFLLILTFSLSPLLSFLDPCFPSSTLTPNPPFFVHFHPHPTLLSPFLPSTSSYPHSSPSTLISTPISLSRLLLLHPLNS
ncbi:hypothetical protein C7M84_004164 [Penaeus vannamei]|uniref:Uncharacterized protein n=1 Tax=Penaeus vannamei TaxID=6689 RepID=A0A3R7MBD1_PENVA|nr:hypothetical protein C7M84_004164 [Penaeus vannamei]